MKKITIMTFGLLLIAAPAFADNGVQATSTSVNQEQLYNAAGNAYQNYGVDNLGNGGVSNVGVANSAGIINQNVNSGAESNVGSATNVALSGGFSSRGGNLDSGNPNNGAEQVSGAYLNQINAYNSTGNAICYNSTVTNYTNGVSQVGVNGSTGVISQQVNAGLASNVGSATGVTIH